MRVLIVDDALFMRQLYRKMLERNDIEMVGEGGNGFEAVALYQELRPDVVVMDITMPGMTGIDALSEIMRIDPNAKVVMASAMGQEVFVRESVARGARAFVVKPIIERNFISTLKSLAGS